MPLPVWVAGSISVSGSGSTIQIDEGGWGGNTNTYTYDATGRLVFNTTTSYGVNGDSYWATSNGPQNVTVQNTSGITMNVARTIGGIFSYSATVTTASNLTLNGTINVNGGWLAKRDVFLSFKNFTRFFRN